MPSTSLNCSSTSFDEGVWAVPMYGSRLARSELLRHLHLRDCFQHVDRRDLWGNKGFHGHDEGLLQGILAGQRGVRNAVSVDSPGATGRKDQLLPGPVLLEVRAGFKPVMQVEHVFIVAGAVRHRQT